MAERIGVVIPTRGVVFTEVVQGVVDNCSGRDWFLLTTIDQGLPDCMNSLVRDAIAKGADWVWVVEEDTVPPPGVLALLLADGGDFVACDYPVGNGHTCFGFDPSDTREVLWTGFGCTLIRADVFARVPEPWFECNRNMVVVQRDGLAYFTADKRTVNHRGGHDLSFCEKLKTAGVAIHGLRDLEARHLKMHGWNTAPTNKACHDIRPVPAIVNKWPAYVDEATCSVVIPCYKQAEYLAEAIESALAQTRPCEVIVVDDGSPDDAAKVAERYPVTLVRQKNKGLAAARNAGIRAATGTHILPLDADDRLHPECVADMLRASRSGLVRARAHLFGDVERDWLPGGDLSVAGCMRANVAASCSLFPKAAWTAVGGYDESMTEGYEDWDLHVRLLAAGYPLATVRDVRWYYRRHGRTMVVDANAKHDEIVAYMRAKWERLGLIAKAPERTRKLGVPVEWRGQSYPAGTRLPVSTLLAMKADGVIAGHGL